MADIYKIRKNGSDTWYALPQPDSGLGYSFEETYTSSSGRISTGSMKAKLMFCVEQVQYKRKGLTLAQLSAILKIIIGRAKFQMYYWSGYEGQWKIAWFQVGKGDYSIGRIDPEGGLVDEFSFNATGTEPVWSANMTEEEAET